MIDELLMIPGPTEISNSVLKEMSSKTVAHYGKKWTEFYNETRSLIKKLIDTKKDLYLFVGSGHAAIDAALGSTIESGDDVLVLSNGIFGDKLAEISKLHNARVTKLEENWGEAISPTKLESFLKNTRTDFKALLMVDVETSTGVKNPVKELSKIASNYNILTFVDGVCSIGIEEFHMDDWQIDICVSASQKGLAAPPGLAIIALNENAWEIIENRKEKITGWYLNLKIMKEFEIKQKDWQPYGITMAVHNVKALNKSLSQIMFNEGLKNRIKRHRDNAKYFRDNLKKLGFKVLCDEGVACNAVTAIKNPEGYNSEDIISEFEQNNIRIGNGLGKLQGDYVRVGHMNQGASLIKINPVLNAFADLLK